MREILFRGKRIDNGEWVEGDLYSNGKWLDVFNKDAAYIGNDELLRNVIPETVGQYTGLNDKNGKKIFEGDICKCDNATGVVKFGKHSSTFNTHVGFYVSWTNARILSQSIFYWAMEDEDVEWHGNIHDNPELLEAGEND